jgi:hypothetical protein
LIPAGALMSDLLRGMLVAGSTTLISMLVAALALWCAQL